MRSAIEASRRKAAPIVPSETDAGQYDLVIHGSPVWAGEMAPALRTYFRHEKHNFNVALFCTLGGANGERALAGMRPACGRAPVAELLVDASALKSGWHRQAHDFLQSLSAFDGMRKKTA